MCHRAYPDPIFKIDVEDGVGETPHRAGPELAAFDRVQLRVLDQSFQGRLELGAELLGQTDALRFVASGGFRDLLLSNRVENQRLHG